MQVIELKLLFSKFFLQKYHAVNWDLDEGNQTVVSEKHGI